MSIDPLLPNEAALLEEVNDEAYGFWEVICWFKGDTYPELSQDQLMELVAAVVERGYLTIFAGPFGGEMEALPRDAALASVRQWKNWQHREPPEPVFSMMTTEDGFRAVALWVHENGLPRKN
jgi:hypothetical protein